MNRRARAFLVLLLGSSLPVFSVEVAWVRLLSGAAEPVVWRIGEGWPSRPSGFPFAPSAVLSYATLAPGDLMSEADLEARTVAWEAMLAESARFSRCSVFPVESGDTSGRRGVIVEVETGSPPLFGGGSAYGSMTLPLVGGRRAALAVEAGPNRSSISYRDDAFRDVPLVLEGKVGYLNDLIETGGFSGHRVGASLGLGPRLGPLCDLILRARSSFPLGEEREEAEAYLALGTVLELASLSLFGIGGLDAYLSIAGDAYPGKDALRLEAVSELRSRLGIANLSLSSGLGLSSGRLDSRELFDLRRGDAFLRGPEGDGKAASEFALARIDADLAALRLSPAAWLHLSAGPFAFCEAALARWGKGADAEAIGADAEAIGAAGGGLRLRLGSPIFVVADIGYALSDRGKTALVFSILSRRVL